MNKKQARQALKAGYCVACTDKVTGRKEYATWDESLEVVYTRYSCQVHDLDWFLASSKDGRFHVAGVDPQDNRYYVKTKSKTTLGHRKTVAEIWHRLTDGTEELLFSSDKPAAARKWVMVMNTVDCRKK